jgi:hypothetical protein
MFFLLFCGIIEGSGSVPRTNGSGSQEAQKHTDLAMDPDPKHCLAHMATNFHRNMRRVWKQIVRPCCR